MERLSLLQILLKQHTKSKCCWINFRWEPMWSILIKLKISNDLSFISLILVNMISSFWYMDLLIKRNLCLEMYSMLFALTFLEFGDFTKTPVSRSNLTMEVFLRLLTVLKHHQTSRFATEIIQIESLIKNLWKSLRNECWRSFERISFNLLIFIGMRSTN